MKKKVIVILSIFTLLFLVSCGSKPEEEAAGPEAPAEEIVENIEEITPEEVDAYLAEIETARERAVKAGAEKKSPAELKEVDDYFASVKDNPAALKKEYTKIIGLYDALASKINETDAGSNLMTAIDGARAKAIKAGAEEFTPEELKKLDDYVATLKADKDKFIKEGMKVPGYYEELAKLASDVKTEAAIENSRKEALAAGAAEVAPEELKKLEDYIASLKEDPAKYEAEKSKIAGYYDSLTKLVNDIKAAEKLSAEIDAARAKAIKAGVDKVLPDELARLDAFVEKISADRDAWVVSASDVPGHYNTLIMLAADKTVIDNIVTNITTSRAKAIEVGAETKTPAELKLIDDYFATIDGDSDSLKANGHKVSNSYKSLVAYVGAKDAKKIIDDENLASYSQTHYDRASAKLVSVEKAYNNISEVPQSIIKDATDARRDFRVVVNIAYKNAAKAERELAYAEKKKADTVRAGVTQKERYKSAVDNFKKGDTLYSMQDAKKAADYYKAAKEEFAALHSDVSEEMLAALAAIEAAKKNVEESSQYAEEADAMAPITGDNIEGIEDEDTVLLEADNYEDPNASVIEVAEDIAVTEDPVVEDDSDELVADEQYVEEESSDEAAPVIADEVVTESAATSEENEVTEDVTVETEE